MQHLFYFTMLYILGEARSPKDFCFQEFKHVPPYPQEG